MHFSSAIVLLAAVASTVSAGHRHQSIHERRHLAKREPMAFNYYKSEKPTPAPADNKGNDSSMNGGDDKTQGASPPSSTTQNNPAPNQNTNANGGSHPAAAAPPASAPAAAAPGSGDRSSGGGTGKKKAFCGGASNNIKRATAFDIGYKGNTGAPGKWGCNIMEIDCGDAHLYDYTTSFTGGQDHDTYSCSAFNKIGPTGGIDPGWHSALDFQVAKGATKCLAFDKNSQGSIACGAGSGGPPKTSWGQRAGSWYEFDCGSDKNDNQSGSDVSVLVANSANGPIIGMAIEAPGKGLCSWIKASGEHFAAYIGGMEALDGVGCTGYSKGQTKVTLGY